MDAEHSGGGSQLRLANDSDFHWIAALSFGAEAAAFSACGCDEARLNSPSCIHREPTAETR
jgi:hypothetical protein